MLGILNVNGASETLGDLRNAYNDLLQQQTENNQKSEAAKAEIKAKENAIKEANQAIHKAESDIEVANQKINESNQKIDEMTNEVNEVLVMLQQLRSNNAYLEYASGASTVTDFVTRIAALEQVSSYMQETMVKLEKEIKDNEALKEELKKKQDELTANIKTYEEAIKKSNQDLQTYNELV